MPIEPDHIRRARERTRKTMTGNGQTIAVDDSEPKDHRGDAWEGDHLAGDLPGTAKTAEPGIIPGNVQAQSNDPWDRPIPLGDAPAVEPFPLALLPRTLAGFVHEVAEALPCPVDYVALPLLTLAGAAIGASRALQIKPGWQERPGIYAAIVAPPGSKKSPALRQVAAPVYAEQKRLLAIYKRQKIAWDEADNDKLPKPKLSTVFVEDITTESLAGVLQDNPRGVVIVRDELTAWVKSQNQYRAKGRGADRQFFLSAWSGEAVRVDRKNQEDGPLFVPHPFLAVIGGLPPDLLVCLRGENAIADGFLDRILFAYPEPLPATGEDWRCVSEDAREAWERVLKFLWALHPEADDDGGTRPHFVRLDSTGRKAWEDFTHALANEVNADGFPPCLRGPWEKFRGYGARLALIVHLLRKATGEVDSEDVDGESLKRAAELVRYFQSQTRKVYAVLEADRDAEKAKRLLEWIHRERKTEFKSRDVWEDVKNRSEFPNVDALDAPLARLVKHQIIRPKPAQERSRGRPPAPVYEVNPHVLQHPVYPVNPFNSSSQTVSQDLRDLRDDSAQMKREWGTRSVVGA